MYGLIHVLYDSDRQKAFESLYADSDASDQLLLRSSLAEALKDCPKLLSSHGTDWILCTLASYHKSEEDTARVFQALIRKLNAIRFGLLTDKIQWKEMNDVADSCLVGISFFKNKMDRMHRRKAAPSVDYYKKSGALAFQRLGYDRIGEDFDGWIDFIEKEFVVTSIS